jgi:hypothetical protein
MNTICGNFSKSTATGFQMGAVKLRKIKRRR